MVPPLLRRALNAPPWGGTLSLLTTVVGLSGGCGLFVGFADDGGAGGATAGPGVGGAAASTASGTGTATGGGNSCVEPAGEGGCSLGTSDDCTYCGHECRFTTCNGAACKASPVGNSGGFQIALDTEYVYSLLNGDLWRVARDAGDIVAPEPVATVPTGNTTYVLKLQGDYLYTTGVGFIHRVPKGGGTVETVMVHNVLTERGSDVLVDGDYLYYTALYEPRVRRLDLTEPFTQTEQDIALATDPSKIVADAGNFYVTDYGGNAILRIPRDNIGSTLDAEVVTNHPAPSFLAIVGDYLYFAAGEEILRVPKNASTPTAAKLIRLFPKPISGLATDGCHILVSLGPNASDNELWLLDVEGQNPLVLLENVSLNFGGVALDATDAFAGGNDAIYRVSR